MKGSNPARLPRRTVQGSLLLSLLVVLPHGLHLPWPVSLFFLITLLWRWSGVYRQARAPRRRWLLLLTLTGILLVYSQHHTLIGRDAGVSLLVVMLGLKLLELRQPRDVYILVFIGYFVVVTQFLFSQSFLLTLYLLGLVISLTALLLEINRARPAPSLFEPLRRSLFIGLQALPIALILFLLFPRLSQPLWQFASDDGSGISGLDDRVSPGSISRLIRSSAVAFRVQFEDQAPPPERRYWRGLVLRDTDGYSWYNRPTTPPLQSPPGLVSQAAAVRYQVFLEPHYRHWLFALDLPARAPANARLDQGFQLVSSSPVERPLQYRLLSYTRYRTQRPGATELQRALRLPANLTRRERQLVARWRARASDDQELVGLALDYFHNQPFIYTLTPPSYPINPSDQFLFEGREGFCEHYASSFALLMRLAGIPSRLVVGYQGGELNPLGDYYILRQSDAHAWSEVYLAGQGWVRVDPTAAVAPERIRHGIQPEFDRPGAPVNFRLDDGGLVGSLAHRLRLILDAANIGWRQWVLGYSQQRQSNLLHNLGLDFRHAWQWTLLLFSLIGLALLLLMLRIGLQGRQRLEPEVRSYRRLCRKLARIGLERAPSEGPLDYARRIASRRPDLADQVERMTAIYIRLRYARSAPPRALGELQRRVRRFRPGRAGS